MIRVKIANPYEYDLDFASLKQAAQIVLAGESIAEAKVIIAFVDDAHIHRLNQQFLNHNEPTDVLTFPYSDPTAKKLDGEIVIGHGVAETQARERGHAVTTELTLYIIHGCLHLCGYNDTDMETTQLMRTKERHYLQQLGLDDVTTD